MTSHHSAVTSSSVGSAVRLRRIRPCLVSLDVILFRPAAAAAIGIQDKVCRSGIGHKPEWLRLLRSWAVYDYVDGVARNLQDVLVAHCRHRGTAFYQLGAVVVGVFVGVESIRSTGETRQNEQVRSNE